jgi:hypothetical protein
VAGATSSRGRGMNGPVLGGEFEGVCVWEGGSVKVASLMQVESLWRVTPNQCQVSREIRLLAHVAK